MACNYNSVCIIGGGLAGCEAAWQLAKRGIPVELYEMRPVKMTPAHLGSGLAELVCSNSFRSDDLENAVGLLHEELRLSGSLILQCADTARIPAGSALAVDRMLFSSLVEEAINAEKNITIKRQELENIPDNQHTIIATGPLTSDALSQAILAHAGQEHLAFFDAIAPIVHQDSIDFSIAWYQSRYDKGDSKDYINCPLTRLEYENFINSLLTAEKMEFKEWEHNTPYFNGCLPIEIMAERGPETLRFGPMKPVGLTNPHNPEQKAYAVVQLRPDNKIGTLYNIVGFQTKLKYGEQTRIFRQIPGLQNAEFARLGGLHRNTFINSPQLLDDFLRLKSAPTIRFAGQITGVEGYLESAAMGFLAGLFTAQELTKAPIHTPPTTTALGALLRHITHGAHTQTFQPMNINYGLFDPLESVRRSDNKKALFSARAVKELQSWLTEIKL